MTKRTLISALALCSALWAASNALAGDSSGVQIKEEKGKLRVEIDGKFFSDYRYEGYSRPFFYPVIGADGAVMNRSWPLEDVPNEEHDHPHHKSLWWEHGDMNGVDFWSEAKDAGQTVHDGFVKVQSGKVGVIQSRDKYVTKDGKIVCTDERTMRFYGGPHRMMDFEVTVHASNGDLVFGDTKEGTMAMRLAETMRLKGKVGKGHIVNSEGVRDGETWGKRAAWVDYYGPVEGDTVGVAIFDHPSNPRHPTWWHVRDYGLFAANPFGIHDFEKKARGAGDLKVPAGDSITFKYRFYFHEGNEKEGGVKEAYEAYVKEKQ